MKLILLFCFITLCFTQTKYEYPLTDNEKKIYERCEWHPDLRYYFNQFLASYDRPVHHKLSHQEMAKAQRELFLLINEYEKQHTHFKKNYDSNYFTLLPINKGSFFKHNKDSIEQYRNGDFKKKTNFNDKEEFISSLRNEIREESHLIDFVEYVYKKNKVFDVYYILEKNVDFVKYYLNSIKDNISNTAGNSFSIQLGRSLNSNLNPTLKTNEMNNSLSFKGSWNYFGTMNESLFTVDVENNAKYETLVENVNFVGVGYSFQIRQKYGMFSYIKTFVRYSMGKLKFKQKNFIKSKQISSEDGVFVPYYVNQALINNITDEDISLSGDIYEMSVKAQTPIFFEENLGLSLEVGFEFGLHNLSTEINYESTFLKKEGEVATIVGGRTVTVSDVKSGLLNTKSFFDYEKNYSLPYVSLNWSSPFYIDFSINSYPIKVGKTEKQLEVILNYTF